MDLQGDGHQSHGGKDMATFSTKMHPYLLSRRQSLETQYLAQRLQVFSLRIQPLTIAIYCSERNNRPTTCGLDTIS